MGETAKRIARSVWNGPFYIGQLSSPTSVGDVLLKILETLWRVAISAVSILIVATVGIGTWVYLEPVLFPPLKSQIIGYATYDDGSELQPPPPLASGSDATLRQPFRCTPQHPIKLTFTNNSNKTLGRMVFSLRGNETGYSNNLVEYGDWIEANAIISPGYTRDVCWAVSVRDGVAANSLNYVVEVLVAEEADPAILSQEFRPVSRSPTPQNSMSASPSLPTGAKPNSSSSSSLGALLDSDWEKIGMGCACSFSTGPSLTEVLLAGGHGFSFYRLDGEERLCEAPDTQELFDGAVSFSCGSARVRIDPSGKVEPGFDGHSSKAKLVINDQSATIDVVGTWSCGC